MIYAESELDPNNKPIFVVKSREKILCQRRKSKLNLNKQSGDARTSQNCDSKLYLFKLIICSNIKGELLQHQLQSLIKSRGKILWNIWFEQKKSWEEKRKQISFSDFDCRMMVVGSAVTSDSFKSTITPPKKKISLKDNLSGSMWLTVLTVCCSLLGDLTCNATLLFFPFLNSQAAREVSGHHLLRAPETSMSLSKDPADQSGDRQEWACEDTGSSHMWYTISLPITQHRRVALTRHMTWCPHVTAQNTKHHVAPHTLITLHWACMRDTRKKTTYWASLN